MERLSHDLNLALEESNCGRQERRKFGLRRRTRSAGNLPAAVAVSLVEDGSSSSPPQAPLITQPLSDSDDPHVNAHKSSSLKSRHYCQIGNFESDSFNENFSPTRPANVRRKRKFKKIPVEYMDGKHSPPIEILTVTTEANTSPSTITLQAQGYSSLVNIGKDKTGLLRQERTTNAFCGKRKWSHRDKDVCEMRERSFSGGCSSKSAFFSKSDFKPKKYELDKKKKDMVIQPGKIVLKSQNLESTKPAVMNTPSLPGSSSFNFVYKNTSKNATPVLSKMMGYRVTTDLPPFLNPTTSSGKNSDYKYHRKLKLLNKTHPPKSLRNPLLFDDSNSGMECTGNDESSSLSSSDSDGLVTNDSDREGDDELTDWPGIEELKVFNKSLSFKTSKTINNNSPQSVSNMPPPKRLKKEKFLAKSGIASCKNKFKKKRAKVESGNEDDAMMSDSKTVVDVEEEFLTRERRDILQPHSSFTSFSEVKNAGGAGHNADETFFHSFQAFQERTQNEEIFEPRTNFTLQKTSSSDLNLSERSVQSEAANAPYEAGLTCDSREILAGCRRVRCSRRGLRIVSSAAEPLARFLQDSCRAELLLPPPADDQETDSLGKLADLYSLDLQVVMGRPVLRKTSNTMQAVEVEHSCSNLPTEHKRRCYGEDDDTTFDEPLPIFAENSGVEDRTGDIVFSKKNGLFAEKNSPITASAREYDTFSESLIDKSLLDPGKLD